MKKKKWFAVALVAAFLAVTGAGTLAYFTRSVRVTNVITTGSVNIELVETRLKDVPAGTVPEEEPYPDAPIAGVMPGTEHSKIVRIKNTGTADAHVRVDVNTVVKLADGGAGDGSCVLFSTNPDIWTEKDGYYYYHEKLAPGASTEPLFTEVQFSPDMGNAYQNCQADVVVQAYATQAANNGETPLDAAEDSWPAEAQG